MGAALPRAPSMLDLVRLSHRRLLPPGGEALYRQIALLTNLSSGDEVLDVACGKGTVLEYFVREHGVHGTGVEADPVVLAQAEAFFKEEGLTREVTLQGASPMDLPFRDETFDVVIGELSMTAEVAPEVAIKELVRVARPGGWVVLSQLVWQAPVDSERKQVLSEHLGASPLMAVESRRILRTCGVGELHTEDWIDEGTAFRSVSRKPFPDFAELFTLVEKLGILRRAWRRWGWRGVRTVFQRESEVHRLLHRERILGLNLLMGVKGGEGKDREAGRSRVESDPPAESGAPGEKDLQTSGLPLFGSGGEEPGP